jgi:hypothetical protein
VAWIESRGSRVVIRVVRVGRRVTPLRQIVRTVKRPESFGVVLTRSGDVAWLASTSERDGEVAVARPGRAPRVLDRYASAYLSLEEGRTLRWSDPTGYHGFFDLRHVPCPSRSHFVPELQTDRVLITRRLYANTIVLRGCDLVTRRDAVVGEQESNIGNDGTVKVVGVDRTWVLLRYASADRYDGTGTVEIATADVSTGDQKARFALTGVASPQAGSFAITDRGIPVWLAGDRLVALGARGPGTVELDRGNAIAGIQASGDRVTWTHDGAPRSAQVGR